MVRTITATVILTDSCDPISELFYSMKYTLQLDLVSLTLSSTRCFFFKFQRLNLIAVISSETCTSCAVDGSDYSTQPCFSFPGLLRGPNLEAFSACKSTARLGGEENSQGRYC